MDVWKHIDDDAQKIYALRKRFQPDFDGDFHADSRAPANEEQHNDEDQHFDHLNFGKYIQKNFNGLLELGF